MADENQTPEAPKPNTDLPKFELPKAAAPTPGVAAHSVAKAPAFPGNIQPSYSSPAAVEPQKEHPALIAVDAIAAAVAIAFAVLIFLD